MRILHVIDHWGLGGAQRALVNLARSRSDVSFSIAALFEHGQHDWDLPESVKLSVLVPSYGHIFRAIKALKALVEKEKPDLIQVHLTGSRFVTAWALRRVENPPPIAWYEHSGLEIFQTYGKMLGKLLLFGQRRLLNNVNALATNSRHTADFCGRYLQAAEVVYCPVDVAAIRSAASAPLKPPIVAEKRGVVAGFVGRLAEQKNPRAFIDAAERAARENPDLYFWIVGDGPLAPVMWEWITATGFKERFTLWGARDDVYALMAQMDLIVMPSRFEPFGLVACEAYALGKPVAGYAVDGLAEVLRDNALGYSVKPGDNRALTKAMLRAIAREPEGNDALPNILKLASADAWIHYFGKVLGDHSAEAVS